jgi:hypothetical protein
MTLYLRSGLLAVLAATVTLAGQLTEKPLRLSEPSHHLFDDRFAREPMLVEHPSGALFVSGYGVPGQPTDVPPNLWKSLDRGKSWTVVDVGSPAVGAKGNSDVDLAMAADGTFYFVAMTFDPKLRQGTDINIGVSRDIGVSWSWTRLSQTPRDDRPWVEVAPDGTAHVIWNDGEGVSYAVSNDGGKSWTERPRIHPEGGSSHLAVGPKGEVAVRITPLSASGFKEHPQADFIAVTVDAGKTWEKHRPPGERNWMSSLKGAGVPRWVEPVAWDAAGALYYLWTNPAGVHLARSGDRGRTWQQWLALASTEATTFFPYLIGGGPGQLAATWFSAKLPDYTTLRTHVARITASASATPQLRIAAPFTFDAVNASGVPQAGGEYVPVAFLRNGTLGLVTPIQNVKAKRLGFSWWVAE